MTWLIVLLACTALNRLRGVDLLPGRSLYYVAPLIGAVSYLMFDAWVTVAWAVAYFVWGVGPWGRWYTLGVLPRDHSGRSSSVFEDLVELPSDSVYVAFFIRNMLVLPGLVLVGWLLDVYWPVTVGLSLTFAIGAVCMYHAGKELFPKYPTVFGELMVGLLWGYTMLLFWGMS